jgi:dTDP-4-dehydrorhamnose 3,5-epimerase
MIFKHTELQDAWLLELERRTDARGFFARTMCRREFGEHGLAQDFEQANTSFNHQRGTLRGMHFQRPPHAEAKLIRCVRGAIYDVIIDLRLDSRTYMRWAGFELTEDNASMLYVPEGFAHGYQTLEDSTEVTYLASRSYAPGAEGGVRFNDPAFRIRWPLPVSCISEKDAALPDYYKATAAAR